MSFLTDKKDLLEIISCNIESFVFEILKFVRALCDYNFNIARIISKWITDFKSNPQKPNIVNKIFTN